MSRRHGENGPHPQAKHAGADDVVGEVRALAIDKAAVDPQVIAAAARAWSPNTIRAFLSDMKLWDAWCRRTRVRAGEATAETVAA